MAVLLEKWKEEEWDADLFILRSLVWWGLD